VAGPHKQDAHAGGLREPGTCRRGKPCASLRRVAQGLAGPFPALAPQVAGRPPSGLTALAGHFGGAPPCAHS